MTSDDGSLEDWIPLISVDSPASARDAPADGVQTNRLALAHLYMKFGWHPAPVHSFTLPLWFGGLYDEQHAARGSAVISLRTSNLPLISHHGQCMTNSRNRSTPNRSKP